MIGLFLLSCTAPPSPPAGLSNQQIAAKVRPGTAEAARWGAAVGDALRQADLPVDAASVCQVLAVIEQESGYDPNPSVPGIDRMVRERLLAQLSLLGPFGEEALNAALEARVDGSGEPLSTRLESVKTERDLDRLYRAIVKHLTGKVGTALAPGWVDRQNPVSTLGSMQVKLEYANEHPASRGMRRDELREHLYLLEGGVQYGTLRLFDTDADYADPIFRFADFNAGPFASRNAAFQRQLQTLSGETVDSDGDLLIYNDRGRPAARQSGQTVDVLTRWAAAHHPSLTADQIQRDLSTEKSALFASTTTSRAVREAFKDALGRDAAHAILPVVTLNSPKLSGKWTTESFAKRVDKRFRTCLAR